MLNRRRFDTLAAGAAIAAAVGPRHVWAQEGAVKLGVLTDMASAYSDQTGPGAPTMFLAGAYSHALHY